MRPGWLWGGAVLAALVGCHDFDSLRRDGSRDGSADAERDADPHHDARVPPPCGTTGLPDCVRPSFVAIRELAVAGGPDLLIQTGTHATWNVDTGELKDGSDTATIVPTVQAQEDGMPKLSVLAVHMLEVESGATLTLTGANAVAILATGDITIDGLLDASGNKDVGGPGGASSAKDGKTSGLWASSAKPCDPKSTRDVLNKTVATAICGGGGGSNATSGGAGGTAKANRNGITAQAEGGSPGDAGGGLEFARRRRCGRRRLLRPLGYPRGRRGRRPASRYTAAACHRRDR
ncbi:MAG: hypothetical protein R3A78_07360 [Polyangiales bacterium]